MHSSHRINYILDTTVLLYDAQALFKFDENNVIIPITVIEDIDHFKKDQSESGRNARQTSRYLDALRQKNSVVKGVVLDNGGTLFVRSGSAATLRRMPGATLSSPKVVRSKLMSHLHLLPDTLPTGRIC